MNKKNNVILRIYAIIYLTINICYVVLELYKFQLRNLFEAYGEIQYINKVFSLAKVSLIMEYVIIIINIFFLAFVLYHDRKISNKLYLNRYIGINLVILLSIKIISIILTKTLLVANGNLNQQNIFTGYITLLAIIISILRALKIFLCRIQN